MATRASNVARFWPRHVRAIEKEREGEISFLIQFQEEPLTSGMEGGPFPRGFTEDFPFFANPSFRFELLCIVTPDLGSAAHGPRAPHDVIVFLDHGAIGPNVIVQSVLLIFRDRGIES
jgi:hypothetical protein